MESSECILELLRKIRTVLQATKAGHGGLGTRLWAWGPGNEAMGVEAWERGYGCGGLGTRLWAWGPGNEAMGYG